MTQHNLRELARQGDPNAIATVINRSLQAKGINADVMRENGSLLVMLESDKVPPQNALIDFIRNGMSNLGVESIHTVRVYGRQRGEEPAWEDEIALMPAEPVFDLDEEAIPPEGSVDDEFEQDGEDYEEPEGEYEDIDEEGEESEEEEEPPSQKRKIPLWAIVLPLIFVPTAVLAGLYFTGNLPFFSSSNSESTASPSPASPSPQAASPTPAPTSNPAKASTPLPKPPSPSPASTPNTTKLPPPPPLAASASPVPPKATQSPAASVKPASPTPQKATPAPAPDPWREAVNKAQTAANLTQKAQSPEDWDKVAALWQQAIALMKKVPQSHPNYAVAQKKASDYQTNLNYAQQNAGSF
ncbi:MAG: hypothetical protein ACM37W_21340 [Actinomycetota bacterium]